MAGSFMTQLKGKERQSVLGILCSTAETSNGFGIALEEKEICTGLNSQENTQCFMFLEGFSYLF